MADAKLLPTTFEALPMQSQENSLHTRLVQIAHNRNTHTTRETSMHSSGAQKIQMEIVSCLMAAILGLR
jgi:hypothetical protein